MRMRDNDNRSLEARLREEVLRESIAATARALAKQMGTDMPPALLEIEPNPSSFEFMLGKSLAQLEGKYRSLIEAAPDPIVVVNTDGEIVLVNVQCEKQFGFSRDELLGRPIAEILPTGLAELLVVNGAPVAAEAMIRQVGNGLELVGRRRDGSEFPVELMLSPIQTAEGVLVTASIRNISAHKAAERQLSQLESRYRGLLEAAPDAMLVINKRGRIVLLNAEAGRHFGYSRDELLGQQVTVIVPEGLTELLTGEASPQLSAAALPGGIGAELSGLRKDGTAFPLEIVLSSLQSPEGPLAIAALRDVTARRAAEAELKLAEQRYRGLVESAREAIVVVDEEGDIVLANRQAERQFGYGSGELAGRKIASIIPLGIAERLREDGLGATESALAEASGAGIRLNGCDRSGAAFPVEVMLSRLDALGGNGLVVTIRDALYRRHDDIVDAPASAAAEAVFSEQQRREVALNGVAEAVASIDRHGRVSFLNRAAETLTGWSLAEAVGRPAGEIVRIVGSSSAEALPDLFEPMPDAVATLPLAGRSLIRRDGTETEIEEAVSPVRDRQGQPAGSVIVFRDVTAPRAEALAMAHSALHDGLTGLPNRMLFNDRVTQAITVAPRHGRKVAVLFVDLDGFKHVNDSLGHATGDKLLQSIARRLVACVRSADTVSRQGGDEFVVLLSEIERPEDATILAARMLQAVSDPHLIDGSEVRVSASIGASVFPLDGEDAETLIKNADTAMYQAKEIGGCHRFFAPAMNDRAAARQSIEAGLRRALAQLEFTLVYQPKVNLRTGEIAGAEALIRWSRSTAGSTSPADFIPVAESTGLIQPIGHWVLREACYQTRAWLDAGLTLPRIAVNVSAFEFRNENFLEGIFSVLDETHLDGSYLELELTESVLMKHVESTDNILRALRDRGVRLAVDDFGTGYSSLSNLRKFPIDTLKIDESFVHQIGLENQDTSIVTTVLNMARGLKLRCVAEGVETAQELAFLQANHCDSAQGYYFSKPLPPQQFGRLLQNGLLATMAARRLETADAFAPAGR